jgi:hypothetical protein
MVTGTAAVTFTRDRGRTLAPRAQSLSGIGYTYGLVALDTPNTLLAWHKQSLLLSTDAGCSWREVFAPDTDQTFFPPTLTAAPGGRAYAWSDNDRYMVRYDSRGAKVLKGPIGVVGFGTDPLNGERAFAADVDGVIWRSDDAGETWDPAGELHTQTSPVIFYRFAFDPSNPLHIVAGTTLDGAYVSRDGGRTWQRSTGLGAKANTFNLVISPLDGNRVWAMSLDLNESDANVPSHGRHIYQSDDGGASFRPVVDESADVKLINGPTMAADARDANVVWFVFGTYFQNYGTDLFRYDDAARELTATHNEHHGINAIAFSPVDPSVMYLGLEVEQR